MEQFAPLIGIGLGAVIAYIIWFSVDYSERSRREKDARERLEAQMASFNAQAQQASQSWATGFTGGYTGYGPTDTRYDPYGLNKPKDNNQSLKDGLKKLL